jgi:hypothetical protein
MDSYFLKKYFLFLFSLFLGTLCIAQNFQITQQPVIWLNANVPGNALNRWEDISGNFNHAYTDTGKVLPLQSNFNFNKSFVFDSSDKALKISYKPLINRNNTLITVYNSTEKINEIGVWHLFHDSANSCFLSSKHIKGINNIMKYTDTNINSPIINTSTQKWKNLRIDSLNSYLLIGGTDSLKFKGEIAEFLLFNNDLTGKDLLKIHTYLAIKYGITLYRSDYISSSDYKIWDYRKNPYYNNEIAGIGKDSLLNINQKQSTADGCCNILTITADKIALSNEYNYYNFKHGDFLIWGSNNGDINASFGVAGSLISNLPNKKWLIQISGKTANSTKTQVVFDAKQVENPGRCLLLINRKADEVFDNATTEVYQPDSIDANSKHYYNNIKWDTDSSGSDIFTFLTGKRLTLLAKTTLNQDNTAALCSTKLEVNGGKPPFIFSLIADNIQSSSTNIWTTADTVSYLYGLAKGNYIATVTDIKGETDTTFFEINNTLTLDATINYGTNNFIFSENKISVFPNPTNSYFYIDIKFVQKEKVEMTYRDIQGKLIKQRILDGSNSYFVSDEFNERGIYYVEFKSNTIRRTVKLVVY